MRHENERKRFKPEQDDISHGEESLVDFLRRCSIDEETWKYILDRPTDPPREISFDDWRVDGDDETTEGEQREL